MTELPSTASGGPRTAFSPAEAEHFYRPLGVLKGPLSSRQVKQEAHDFWRTSGEEGIRWLLQRLKDEHYIETLLEVASILTDLGETIIGPCFEVLSQGADGDQAFGLLSALSSLAEANPSLRVDAGQWEPILSNLLRSKDSDVREQAAESMRLLGPERAMRWLELRLPEETNHYARQTIEDELMWHRKGRS